MGQAPRQSKCVHAQRTLGNIIPCLAKENQCQDFENKAAGIQVPVSGSLFSF